MLSVRPLISIDKIGEKTTGEIASRGCLDYIYMMNYDFFGVWDSKIGHQTNLLPAQGFVRSALGEDRRWSIDASIRAFEKYGFPKSKLPIGGRANYARWY